jgi:ATP/ADP translocase
VIRLLRRFVDVRETEAAALLWSFLYFFCLLAAYSVLHHPAPIDRARVAR